MFREQGAHMQAEQRPVGATLLVIGEACSPVFMSRRSMGPNLSNRRSTSRGLASYSKLPALCQDLSMSFKGEGMHSCEVRACCTAGGQHGSFKSASASGQAHHRRLGDLACTCRSC